MPCGNGSHPLPMLLIFSPAEIIQVRYGQDQLAQADIFPNDSPSEWTPAVVRSINGSHYRRNAAECGCPAIRLCFQSTIPPFPSQPIIKRCATTLVPRWEGKNHVRSEIRFYLLLSEAIRGGISSLN